MTSTIHVGVKRLKEATGCYRPETDKQEIEKEGKREQACQTCIMKRELDDPRSVDLPSTYTYSFASLKQLVVNEGICPVAYMDRATADARIVVLPHDFLSDPGFIIKFKNEQPTVLIVDEAHNFLSDSGSKPFLEFTWRDERDERGNFSEESKTRLSARKINLLEAAVGRQVDRFVKWLSEPHKSAAISALRDLLQAATEFETALSPIRERRQDFVITDARPSDAEVWHLAKDLAGLLPKASLREMLDRQVEQIAVSREKLLQIMPLLGRSNQKALASLIGRCEMQIFRLREVLDSTLDFYAVLSSRDICFYTIPPRHEVSHTLTGYSARVFTSATIRPVRLLGEIMGLKKPLAVEIPHIFPAENYKSFFVVGYHSSKETIAAGNEAEISSDKKDVLKRTLKATLEAAVGRNVGIFVNSNQDIPTIVSLVRSFALPDALILGQLPYENANNRFREARETFRRGQKAAAILAGRVATEEVNESDVAQTFIDIGGKLKRNQIAVLVAVQGGTLSEGIDYKGKAMEMVINIGLPYPPPGEKMTADLKKNYWMSQWPDDPSMASDLAFRQEAFRKLAQSIGRAHRNPRDRAVVVLIDERLLAIKSHAGQVETLNEFSAARNRLLLQAPVAEVRANIVLAGSSDHSDRSRHQIIRGFANLGVALTDDDFLKVDEMKKQIEDFFRESDAGVISEN